MPKHAAKAATKKGVRLFLPQGGVPSSRTHVTRVVAVYLLTEAVE